MCHRAWIDLFKDVMASTFPLHLILYSMSALTRSKGEPLEKLILSYVIGNSLRSSLSIAYCFFFLCAFACISSAYLGHFSPGQVLFSCLAAVYLGFKLEEPRRVPKWHSLRFNTVEFCPKVFIDSSAVWFTQLTRCVLRLRGSTRSWHDPAAALLAGLCLALWPSPRITLFFAFKFLELCYSRGEEAGVLPSGSEGTHSALFAICCGVLLTVGVLQPHLVRPSYRAFIDRVIGKRMRYINVPAIATLGYGTTSIVPDVPVTMPELDPRFVSRRYKETLWVWAQ
ncbi:hypothetical protein HPB49_021720 [Dermacentor silvarum]|uniref:Uncharacterized protein n=1 Tax=Dermacentor silvarum TaxID=543639 RepID=A0ACB8CHI2_DERSI|nr:hypothetical protein HPB49_021720 [Dermacentor silvarum]